MSLVSLILRIATVQALRNATFAGGNVHDSKIDPETLVGGAAEPFIIVAIDSADSAPTGRDLLCASGTAQLTLDLAVASRVKVETEGEGDEPDLIVIPHADGGMEITLDLMVRQLHRVLCASQGPWPTLWRRIVTKIEKVQADRGASAEDGVRYATRQIILTLNTIAEPSFCAPVGVWADALGLMRDEPLLRDIAKLLEVEIETPELSGWERAVADLGLGGSYSLGGEALLETPPQTVTDIDVQFDSAVWGINEQAIEDALGPEPDQTEQP